ncbi:MAG: FtsX-like permease family protein [Deltaproteobacteria bacterium]|nr:MAG: FtsX-like permease family protein [Deltaproteobacteria bacterium]
MDPADYFRIGFGALRGHRLRSFLSMLGIAIGITAVILLTSIGEGTRRYLITEFTQFGTNVLAINPGKTETSGLPGVFGGTTHKLTLDDSEALKRLWGVKKVVPLAMGQARVEGNGRGRSVFVYGVTSDVPEVWKFEVGQGAFLPPGDPRRGSMTAVLGPTLKRELFGDENALGEFVRVAGFRLRVIGVMAPKGRILGIDIDDAAYVPVATAMQMFNLDELMEIDLLFSHAGLMDGVVQQVTRVLTDRHAGREDFTITTQTAMLDVFENVMNVITASVGAIAGISLLVGAIGILTMMWITVNERVHEIGLMRALGATAAQVQRLFLLEAVILTLVGGVLGIAAGLGIAQVLSFAVPGMPVYTPLRYMLAALVVSALTGLLSGVAPARRAASLDPVEALRAQ